MENSLNTYESPASTLYLKGSIYFDSEGKEVLKDKLGKSYLMDTNIKTHWRIVESILSCPGNSITTIDELISKIPKSKRREQTQRIISKFLELDLIGLRS